MNPAHGRVITIESFYDGSVASTKREVEVSVFSTKETILKDIIESLSVISSGETAKLDLCVQVDGQGRWRLVKRWTV